MSHVTMYPLRVHRDVTHLSELDQRKRFGLNDRRLELSIQVSVTVQ